MSANLTREEISLLLEMQGGQIAEAAGSSVEPSGVRPLDLAANEERIYRGRLPGLETIFERFCRELRPSLSKNLNRNVHCAVAGIENVKFGSFLKKLPLPSSLHVFRMRPLPAQALLFLSTPLAFALVESLLGGKGKKALKAEAREFSPIETRLIGKAVGGVLDELQTAWSTLDTVECTYVRSELNPLAVTLVPSTDNVVLVHIETTIEEVTAPLVFCLPAALLAPVREKLSSGLQSIRTENNDDRKRIASHLRQTDCEIRVVLAEGRVKVRDLLELRVGEVLPLSTPASAPARIFVEGKEKFAGTAGVSGANKAVSITRK